MTDPAPNRRRRTMTLRDVSEASGVSEMTVSRVLRGRADVSAETRARVLGAARRLGYVPNRIAGALASQRVNLVAVIVPSMSNMVFPEVLAGISEGLEGSGLQPVVGLTRYDPGHEEAVIYDMLSWRPAGVIVAGLEHSEAARAMLGAAECPVVEIMDSDGAPVDSLVGISHRRAGGAMAQAIVAAGYRRIGFVGTRMVHDHRAAKRLAGFEAGLAAHGLALEDRADYAGSSSLAKGRDLTEALVRRCPDLDFIYYTNDMVGAGGLLWCAAQGIAVPERMGLAGFNALEILGGLPRRLATMDSCRHEIGRRAAEIIRAGERGRLVELTPTLQPGDTIRRPLREETP
ncbi:MAG: LacI family DNA-binding transcriptional regulator [Gemmobacter sp.]